MTRLGRFLCRIGVHDENRSQGPVGYCGRDCGNLKRWYSNGHTWTRYVEPPLPTHSWGEMTCLGYRWVNNPDGMSGKWYPPPGSLPKLPQSAFNLETDR